jgi:large subunit ribosomal protein L22
MTDVKVGRSIQKYMKIGPRKVRPVLDVVRYKHTQDAADYLKNAPTKAAGLILLGLKAALASAKGHELDETRLYISLAKADGGPSLKRFMTRSMGRSDQILKRTSHITLEVKEGKAKKVASPVVETPKEKAPKASPIKKKTVAKKAAPAKKPAAKKKTVAKKQEVKS